MLPKAEYFSQALYTFDIGQNDLASGYFHNMSTDQVKAYVPDVLAQFKNVIKVVYVMFLVADSDILGLTFGVSFSAVENRNCFE